MTLRLTLLALSTIVALAGCGDDSSTSDTGTGTDTGTPTDSGGGTDTGTPTDSGGGDDSSTPGDSGGGTDTGTPGDSGGGTDTGIAVDSGGGGTDTGTAPSGACTNRRDQRVIDATDIAADAEACGRARGCFGGRMCVIDCMRDDVGVSMGCAECFGDVAQCTRDNCALRCIDSSSAGCIQCRADNGCTTDFETCSGLPGT